MTVNGILRATGAVGLGTLLLAGSAAAAGMVVGKVTAVDSTRNSIEINGARLQLTDASRRVLLTRIHEIQPGTTVLFEANGNQLVQIEPMQGGADLPRVGPLGTDGRTGPAKR